MTSPRSLNIFEGKRTCFLAVFIPGRPKQNNELPLREKTVMMRRIRKSQQSEAAGKTALDKRALPVRQSKSSCPQR
jgi:hypothetical protein